MIVIIEQQFKMRQQIVVGIFPGNELAVIKADAAVKEKLHGINLSLIHILTCRQRDAPWKRRDVRRWRRTRLYARCSHG